MASALAPEIDHVVPVADGGSNDLENARVISFNENHNVGGAPGRPNRSQQRMRAYQDFNIDRQMGAPAYVPLNKNIAQGDNLVMNDIKSLARYANVAIPNTYADINTALVTAIDNANVGSANDVDIA